MICFLLTGHSTRGLVVVESLEMFAKQNGAAVSKASVSFHLQEFASTVHLKKLFSLLTRDLCMSEKLK